MTNQKKFKSQLDSNQKLMKSLSFLLGPSSTAESGK